MLKQTFISQNISFNELVRSKTAKRLGIVNEPNPDQLENCIALANNIFEPLRAWVGGPIKVNSFFRSEKLNRAIPGASGRSQHLKGEAVDIDDTYKHATNKQMFWFIVNHLDYDQIIWEYGTSKNPDWVHVSYKRNGKKRKSILRATRNYGKTHYVKYSVNQARVELG